MESPFFIKDKFTALRKNLIRFLGDGGLPGFFAARRGEERAALLADWIDLTVERDFHQFPKSKAESDLARRILEGLATLEHPDLSSIAKFCGRDPRLVKRHLTILKELFVIEELSPHPWGVGKPIYFMCDVG